MTRNEYDKMRAEEYRTQLGIWKVAKAAGFMPAPGRCAGSCVASMSHHHTVVTKDPSQPLRQQATDRQPMVLTWETARNSKEDVSV